MFVMEGSETTKESMALSVYALSFFKALSVIIFFIESLLNNFFFGEGGGVRIIGKLLG